MARLVELVTGGKRGATEGACHDSGSLLNLTKGLTNSDDPKPLDIGGGGFSSWGGLFGGTHSTPLFETGFKFQEPQPDVGSKVEGQRDGSKAVPILDETPTKDANFQTADKESGVKLRNAINHAIKLSVSWSRFSSFLGMSLCKRRSGTWAANSVSATR